MSERTAETILNEIVGETIDGAWSKSSDVLYNAAMRIIDSERELIQTGEQLKSTVDRVNANILAGNHINSLGELQSRAANYDRACALREERIDALKALAYALKAEA